MTVLAIGPAMAIQNSLAGVSASLSIEAMPPSAKSVMPRTGTPKRRATVAWDSSCSTMQMKKSSAVEIDRVQTVAVLHELFTDANSRVRDSAISQAMTIQL